MKAVSKEGGLPGRKRYAIGALLIFLAVFGVPGAIFWFVFSRPDPVQFLAPGPLDFAAKDPGKYVLWHDYETLFNGVTYSSNALPPGLLIKCINAKTGVTLPVRADQGTTMGSSDAQRQSVAAVDIQTPGHYLVSVEGTSQPIVFSFGPTIFGKMFFAIFGAFPVVFALFIGGIVLIVHTLVRRSRMLREGNGEKSFVSCYESL